MTKNRYKVWDSNNWGQVMWLDTRLEQLVHQASRLPRNHLRMTTYAMSSPIPPLLASQQENYSMVTTVTRRRFSKEIAEELIAVHGAFAHLHALEKLDGYVSDDLRELWVHDDLRELWRDVLVWLDELTGESK